jgi:hypothetical protein
LLFSQEYQFTKYLWMKQDVKQPLKQSMGVLLTLGADCSLVTSKPAHLSPYLPTAYGSKELDRVRKAQTVRELTLQQGI